MDGTLTIPNLDFGVMYDRCGIDRQDDILTAIASMDKASAQKANAIIDEMEAEGRRTLQLMPGTVSLLKWLAHYQIPTAIVTRNTQASTERLLELLLQQDPELPPFSPIVSRDFPLNMPPKPDTAALEYISKEWKMELNEELVMVGDSPSNDIVFGKTAGVSAALLWQQQQGDCGDDGGANVIVSQLVELPRHLYKRFHLPTPVPLVESTNNTTPPTPTSNVAKAAYGGDLTALQSHSLEEMTSTDKSGNTPLIWASEAGHAHIVEYLLGTIISSSSSSATTTPGANNNNSKEGKSVVGFYINEKGFRGSTAVSRAARNGHTQLVDMLTNHATLNANIPNAKLQYPLHVAAFRQYSSIVQALLQAGADPHVIDGKGRTPLADTKCSTTKELLRVAMLESPAPPVPSN